jgi:3-oxoacyl-[acyl-carrier-protein] synthase-3
MNVKVQVVSTGSYYPEKVMTNEEIVNTVDTSDEWIVSKLGIRERRIAREDEPTSDLAVAAARQALVSAGMEISQIDLIIVATATPDRSAPSTAAIVQGKLGKTSAAAFDINAVCSGYIYAQTVASCMISSGLHSNALVIGADRFSGITDWSRRDCCFFGDGAGAVILKKTSSDSEIITQKIYADGSGWENFTVAAGGSEISTTVETMRQGLQFFQMDGKAVFDTATKVLPKVIQECLDEAGLSASDIDHVLPHQPSINILKKTAEITGIPWERFHTNMDRFANTSGATIPLIMDEVNRQGKLSRGDLVLMIGVGSGWTWGASILRW